MEFTPMTAREHDKSGKVVCDWRDHDGVPFQESFDPNELIFLF